VFEVKGRVPSSVDAAAQLAERNARRASAAELKAARRGRRIQVRRFAGPEAYVDSLEHVRIAHLTDLHVGRVTPMKVQYEAVTLTNAEEPDLVVLTGDFVCHSQVYLDELTDVVRRFEAPVICVLGNHDYWSGAEEVRRALRRAGAEILDNRNTTVTLRHQRLQILGLDDAYTGHAHRDEALKGLRPDLPVLALSHIAEEADALWAHGVPLVLSGHTHGGQVTLARLHELAVGKLAGHRYIHGLYGSRRTNGNGEADDETAVDLYVPPSPFLSIPPPPGKGAGAGAVYVGAGIGAAILPFRLGERGQREVTIFELGHELGAFDEHHGEQRPLKGRRPSEKTKYKRHVAVVAKQQKRLRKKARGRRAGAS